MMGMANRPLLRARGLGIHGELLSSASSFAERRFFRRSRRESGTSPDVIPLAKSSMYLPILHSRYTKPLSFFLNPTEVARSMILFSDRRGTDLSLFSFGSRSLSEITREEDRSTSMVRVAGDQLSISPLDWGENISDTLLPRWPAGPILLYGISRPPLSSVTSIQPL